MQFAIYERSSNNKSKKAFCKHVDHCKFASDSCAARCLIYEPEESTKAQSVGREIVAQVALMLAGG